MDNFVKSFTDAKSSAREQIHRDMRDVRRQDVLQLRMLNSLISPQSAGVDVIRDLAKL